MTIDTRELRDLATDPDAYRSDLMVNLDLAACALDAQQAEIDRYRRASERWKKVAESAEGRVRDHAAEIAEAKGQIEYLDRQNNALREALEGVMALHKRTGESWNEHFERVGGLFYRETGMLRPGKDSSPHTGPSGSERQEEFDKWVAAKFDAARAALSGESKC